MLLDNYKPYYNKGVWRMKCAICLEDLATPDDRTAPYGKDWAHRECMDELKAEELIDEASDES